MFDPGHAAADRRPLTQSTPSRLPSTPNVVAAQESGNLLAVEDCVAGRTSRLNEMDHTDTLEKAVTTSADQNNLRENGAPTSPDNVSSENFNLKPSGPLNIFDVSELVSRAVAAGISESELSELYTHLAKVLFKASGLPERHRDDFEKTLHSVLVDFQRKDAEQTLPERPVRDFRPHQETIIEYIRSPEGFGPWLAAGILSRPLIREISWSSRPYDALANWMRTKKLPDDIDIPTKSQLVAREIKELEATGNVAEHKRWANRTASRLNRASVGT